MRADREKYDGGTKNWVNYYWFYYKWHIIIIGMLISAITICTIQCASRVQPDYYVVFYSDSYVLDEGLDIMASEIGKSYDDRNEDDKLKIQAVNCTFSDDAGTQMRANANQKAVLQVQSSEACIWVLDEEGAKIYYESGDLDIFAKDERLPDYNNFAINIKDTTIYDNVKEIIPEGEEYFIFFRRTANDDYRCVENTRKVLDSLIK